MSDFAILWVVASQAPLSMGSSAGALRYRAWAQSWSSAGVFLQEIFRTQGSNPCLLYWQADSLPLCHLGSPKPGFGMLAFGALNPYIGIQGCPFCEEL